MVGLGWAGKFNGIKKNSFKCPLRPGEAGPHCGSTNKGEGVPATKQSSDGKILADVIKKLTMVLEGFSRDCRRLAVESPQRLPHSMEVEIFSAGIGNLLEEKVEVASKKNGDTCLL